MLQLTINNIDQPPFELNKSRSTIGRHPDNDIVINQAGISDFHCEIQIFRGRAYILDLDSKYGSYINDQRISGKTLFSIGDTIRVDMVELTVLSSHATDNNKPKFEIPKTKLEKKTNTWVIQQIEGSRVIATFPINSAAVIGRDPSSNICLIDDGVSAEHAELSIINDTLNVKDLNSLNGTYVNDKKIENSLLKNGDSLKIDTIEFKIERSGAKNTVPATVIKKPENINHDPLNTTTEAAADDATDKTHEPATSIEHRLIVKENKKNESNPIMNVKATKPWYEFRIRGPQGTTTGPLSKLLKTAYTKAFKLSNNSQTQIVGMTAPFTEEIFSLSPGENKIGRNKENEIVLNHNSISDFHAKISNVGSNCEIIDLISTAGIKVNGISVKNAILNSKDTIALGPFKFLFTLADDKQTEARENSGKTDTVINYRFIILCIFVAAISTSIFFLKGNVI